MSMHRIQHVTVTLEDCSVLDLQWSPHQSHRTNGHLLAVATSTGSIMFYSLRYTFSRPVLEHVESKQVCDEGVLVLFLAMHPTRTDTLGMTLSNGNVCTMSTDAEGFPCTGRELSTVFTHSLEAWVLAFHGNTVYSGGDDAVLQLSQLASGSSLWQNRKIHAAGITYILPLSDELVLTGSYDDHIRLLHVPMVGRKCVLAEEDLGGGVWRLKMLQGGAPIALQSGAGGEG